MILKFAVDVVHRAIQLQGFALGTVQSVEVRFWVNYADQPAVRVTVTHDMGLYAYTQSYRYFCHAG